MKLSRLGYERRTNKWEVSAIPLVLSQTLLDFMNRFHQFYPLLLLLLLLLPLGDYYYCYKYVIKNKHIDNR